MAVVKIKDPFDWVAEQRKAGLTSEQIQANFERLKENAVPTVAYRLIELFEATPNPDATTLKRWFDDMRQVYSTITDEFLRRETRQILGAFFTLDERQLADMLADRRPQAPAAKPEAPIEPWVVLEIELLRRMYLDAGEREWWVDREQLLSLWTDEPRQVLGYLLIKCWDADALEEAIATGFGGIFSDEITSWLIGLGFTDGMKERTEWIVAQHYNLTLPARRTELAKQYSATKDPALLESLKHTKPINPAEFV